ncbi:MAG: HD domain-containing protein [Bacteroidales bacterium]|jgi:hypothetical protein|nr:HD domain-containing protein [Bacteroidales bacterium]
MDPEMYNLTEQFVIESFSKAGRKHEIQHLERTVYWLRQIYPPADDAMLVAAISHDIERAFRKDDMSAKEKELGFISIDFFRIHEERGAGIMVAFLGEYNQPEEFIKKVSSLISRHEEGGDKEQNILKDADSLSFLENNADHFIADKIQVNGYNMVKEKICWMFDRITMPEARELALPFYQNAVWKLTNNKNSDQ